MPDFEPENTFQRATTYFESKRYAELAGLCDEVLKTLPNDFVATYFRGLAAMGLGYAISGRKFMWKAEAIFPEIRKYDFMTPVLCHKGVQEIEILSRRLVLMLEIQSSDNFILSYPKCGRTWVRLMLGTYAMRGELGDPLEVETISRKKPDLTTIEISHDDYPHWKPVGDIVGEKEAYRGKRVIFLVRDPRDVIVSYFFQYTLRGDKERANNAGFNGDLGQFIRQDIGGLKSLVRYYNVWAANREAPAAFKLVTYEDLHEDVRGKLGEILDFIGWPDYGPDALDQAVAAGSFENMRHLEANDILGNPRLQPPTDGNPEGFKVRRGVVGGFRDYLADPDIAWIDEYINAELDDVFARYKYVS